MTASEKNLLIILKDILHPTQTPSELSLPIDWDAVMKSARKQNLLPLIYDAAGKYPGFEDFERKNPNCFTAVMNTVSMQMRKEKDFLELYTALSDEGIEPIVMKGIVCRSLYGEKGDFRASGDEDILIEKKDFEKVAAVFARCGYVTEDIADSGFEIIQEATFHNSERDLQVEVHLNPFGIKDKYRRNMNKYFLNVFDSEERIEVQGVSLRTLTPTDHFLFLVFHNFKHFITGGFGIRLLADELLFMEKYCERIDWDYVKRALREVGTEKFFADSVILGNMYLGFDLAEEKGICPDELLNDMLLMGTFGNTTRQDCAAERFVGAAVQENSTGSKKTRKMRAYFRMLFPSWHSWVESYPYLNDRPWMISAEFCKRVMRYMKKETSMSTPSQAAEGYKAAERRLDLMKKYNIV